MKYLFCFILSSSLLTCFSQDLKASMELMYEKLNKHDNYRLTVNYSAGDTTDAFNSGAASVLVSDKGMFYLTDFATMMVNNDKMIIVNAEDKTLIYSDNSKYDKKNHSNYAYSNILLNGIDSLITTADSVYFAIKGDKPCYFLRFKNQYFNLIEIVFKDNIISEVLYYYNDTFVEEQGLTAKCKLYFEGNPVFDPNLLETNYYLTYGNGAYSPTEEFRNYVLIYNESTDSYFK